MDDSVTCTLTRGTRSWEWTVSRARDMYNSGMLYQTVAEVLEDENDKLRELSSIMLKCIKANERKALICWECPMHKQFDELRSYCCLEHEAKKLGVEIGQ